MIVKSKGHNFTTITVEDGFAHWIVRHSEAKDEPQPITLAYSSVQSNEGVSKMLSIEEAEALWEALGEHINRSTALEGGEVS